jgi:hypothetical protein
MELPQSPPDRPAAWVRLHRNQMGATTLEYCLLLAAIAFPGYFLINSALNLLVEHYRLMTFLNSLPFP